MWLSWEEAHREQLTLTKAMALRRNLAGQADPHLGGVGQIVVGRMAGGVVGQIITIGQVVVGRSEEEGAGEEVGHMAGVVAAAAAAAGKPTGCASSLGLHVAVPRATHATSSTACRELMWMCARRTEVLICCCWVMYQVCVQAVYRV